jgi:hypothetical protein
MRGKIENLCKAYRRKITQSSLGMALFINLCFIVLIFVFCDSKYEVSDDFVMASILSGAYGDGTNPHMIFVNVILGYILMPLYYLFPQVSWYYVFQIAVIFLSSVTITYLLFEWTERTSAKVLSILFIVVFTGEAYILVQFTKTAIFAIMAGALMFIWALFHKKGIGKTVWGAALCIVGVWIRFKTIYVAGMFILLMLAYEVVRQLMRQKATKAFAVWLSKILVCGGILILLAYAGRWLNAYSYSNEEAYSYFRKYNSARSQIVDYAVEDYNIYEEELRAIGISENDFYMITTWSFADNEVFSLETMEQIARIVRDKAAELRGGFTDVLNNIQSREFLKYPACIACLILLGLSIILNPKRWWLTLGSLAGSGGLLFYFSYIGRSVYRVEWAVFFAAFISGLYFWENQKESDASSCQDSAYIYKVCTNILGVLCVGSLVLYIPDREYRYIDSQSRKAYIDNTFYTSWNYGTGKMRKVVNKDKPENGLLEELENNEQNFYFLDFNTTIQTLYYEWPPWEALPSGYYSNCLYLGGITTNFPEVNQILEEKEYSNPLKELVDDNVYLVDNKGVDLKLNYLREHYYPEARAELYKEVDGYQIWKFYN